MIVPAHSWISTSESVTQAGGSVIFYDTEEGRNTIAVDQIENLISERTVGIIPVHLYGQPAQMDEVMRIANLTGYGFLKTARRLISRSFRAPHCFRQSRNLFILPWKKPGAWGDAGAIITDDQELALKMAKFSRHGGLVKGVHEMGNKQSHGWHSGCNTEGEIALFRGVTRRRQQIAA